MIHLRAMISVHNALFRRTLDLRRCVFAVKTILGYAAGGVVGVTLAVLGLGVWGPGRRGLRWRCA